MQINRYIMYIVSVQKRRQGTVKTVKMLLVVHIDSPGMVKFTKNGITHYHWQDC